MSYSVTVWNNGTWKVWKDADANQARNDEGWLCELPVSEVIGSLFDVAKDAFDRAIFDAVAHIRATHRPSKEIDELLFTILEPALATNAGTPLLDEVVALRAAISSRCQCRFEAGERIEECHYHACERHVRLDNGDPSDVTLLDEVARLRSTIKEMIDNCGCEQHPGPCANCERGDAALADGGKSGPV